MDKDEVEQLLNIANLSRQWPNLAPIHGAAMQRLEEHAKEVGEKIAKKREDEMKAKAEEQAKAEAAAKPKEAETKKWQGESSQSSDQIHPKPRPLGPVLGGSPKQET